MRLGFHLSIAGSLLRAIGQAQALGCQALQIFIQNPRAWKWREIPRPEIEAFISARRLAGLGPLAVHLTYLPNLASVDAALHQKSGERLARELALARDLEADYLICHPGHAPLSLESFQRVARTLAAAVDQIPPPPLVLLENTAGQGQELGWLPEHLGLIMRLADVPLGLCLDTSHAFGAGYDLRHPAGVARLLQEIALGPGLESLKIIHLNDSRAPLGSRRDRHAHLGQGAIGLAGFRHLFSHPWLQPHAAIMETPKRHQADEWRNLLTARSLISTKMLVG
ncbi:MAG: deoxyribonuclease IV [Desulfobaccales bacterium]